MRSRTTRPPRVPAAQSLRFAVVREILSGIHTWSVFSEEKGLAFNGYAVETPIGTVLVDPPVPEEGWDGLDALAPFAGVYVTNRSHSRGAEACAQRYGAPVRVHEHDAERAEAAAAETVRGGETIGDAVVLVHVPGKSPGEVAFHVPAQRALIVGDVVIGVPPGGLSTYPEDKIDDREQLIRSAARLLELDFESLLLCDGAPLLAQGREELRRFVEGERTRSPAEAPGPPAPPKLVRRLLHQRRRHVQRPKIVRALWVAAAFTVVAAGVAMLLLPGPALVVIPIGLAMLALEFTWAERALERVLKEAESAKDKAGHASATQKTLGIVAVGLGLAAFVTAAYVWDIPLLPL